MVYRLILAAVTGSTRLEKMALQRSRPLTHLNGQDAGLTHGKPEPLQTHWTGLSSSWGRNSMRFIVLSIMLFVSSLSWSQQQQRNLAGKSAQKTDRDTRG